MIAVLDRASPGQVLDEFDRQLATLVRLGYSERLSLSPENLRDWARIQLAPWVVESTTPNRIPFVIVVAGTPDDIGWMVESTALRGKAGQVSFAGARLSDFRPIESITLPTSRVYLLTDIDTGGEFLNVTPDESLPVIQTNARSPLTITEGIALITHYPDLLRSQNCFSLLGSRSGDRRVPALWISQGRPKLGWCWAGNPHTWLGSAHAGSRIGLS